MVSPPKVLVSILQSLILSCSPLTNFNSGRTTLFDNKVACWKQAPSVLRTVLLGYTSDPLEFNNSLQAALETSPG